MSAPTLVVIGSGPGIALAFTKLFAQRKLSKIALLSRYSMRLEDDKKAILESVPGMELDIKCWGVDIAKKDIFEKVLAEVSHFGDVSCVLFNAAKVVTSEISKFPGDEIITDFTANFSLLLLFTCKETTLISYRLRRWRFILPLAGLSQSSARRALNKSLRCWSRAVSCGRTRAQSTFL